MMLAQNKFILSKLSRAIIPFQNCIYQHPFNLALAKLMLLDTGLVELTESDPIVIPVPTPEMATP